MIIKMRYTDPPKKIKNRVIKAFKCPKCKSWDAFRKEGTVVQWDEFAGRRWLWCTDLSCDYQKLVQL